MCVDIAVIVVVEASQREYMDLDAIYVPGIGLFRGLYFQFYRLLHSL